jgi:hypothetical protein
MPALKRTEFQRNLDVVARYKAFYASPRPGLMARVAIPAQGLRLPSPMPVGAIDWRDPASCRAYARSSLEFMRAYYSQIPRLDDDDLPKIQNLAGTGAIAAAYVKDAQLNQEETTNYLVPPVTDWSRDVGRIGFDPQNPWYQAQMTMLQALVEEWDGSFGIVPFVHFDPLDLCNQLRGNELFLDYYDHPAELRDLLETATRCVLELEAHMRANFLRGYAFEGCLIGCWTPGTYLSCDAGDLGSAAALREWGLPYTQRIVQAWGGAFLHHHELGIHQIPTWSECAGLTLQFPNRDPNTPHLSEMLTVDQLSTTLRVPLAFIAPYRDFKARASFWATGKCVVTVVCDDASQAADVVHQTARLRNF